jgi:hypothetical protein
VPGQDGALPHLEIFGIKLTVAVAAGLAAAYSYAGW